MIGFLSGVATAAVLGVVMLFAMQTLYVPTERVYDGPNLELSEHLIEQGVGGTDNSD